MNPIKRTDDLVVEHTGAETLVYDLRTNDAHHLDANAARVWDAVDGLRTVDEIAAAAGVEVTAASVALMQLDELTLIELPTEHTRRETLRRSLAGAAALAAAVPVIASLSAPEAAQAATLVLSGGSCTAGRQCASGICKANNMCQ